MALANHPLMTAEDFLALPPTEQRTQLIDGVIVVSDPTVRHQRIALEIARLLANWTIEHPGTGEAVIGCNFRMDRHNVFVPDVWWIREDRRVAGDPLWIDGPPDIVVEVRSPSAWRYDIGRKKELYLASGHTEVWLVDTAADEVLVFRGDEALELGRGDRLSTPLVAGFEIDLAALFDR